MGRKFIGESECVFCLRKLKKNIQSLKTSSICKANQINAKLTSLISPSHYNNLNDRALFPDPRVCTACVNLINNIYRNAIKIENFTGASINCQVNSDAAVNGDPTENWPAVKVTLEQDDICTSGKESDKKPYPTRLRKPESYVSLLPEKSLKVQQRSEKLITYEDSGEETDDYFNDDNSLDKPEPPNVDSKKEDNATLSHPSTLTVKTRSQSNKNFVHIKEKSVVDSVMSDGLSYRSDNKQNTTEANTNRSVDVSSFYSPSVAPVPNTAKKIKEKEGNFTSVEALEIHPTTKLDQKNTSASFESSPIKELKSIRSEVHQQSHASKLPHLCPYGGCGKRYSRTRDLRSHIFLHTGEKPFQCEADNCGKRFRLKDQYRIHRRTHTGERPFKCLFPSCEKAFMSSQALRLHKASHSSDLPFCCEQCGKRFSHPRYLKLHKMSHQKNEESKAHSLPEKTFPCEVCGKMLSSQLNVRRHVNFVHKGMKYKRRENSVFVCEIDNCNRSFRWKSCMVRHKALIHRQEDYKHRGQLVKYICPVADCRLEFNRANPLRRHLASFHGKPKEAGNPKTFREWLCLDCGLAVTKKQMGRHKETYHTLGSLFNAIEQGVYVCQAEQCGVALDSGDKLKAHILSHQDDPPYRCPKDSCTKAFHLKKNLDIHIMLHDNVKPFPCSYDTECHESFVTQMCLMRHSQQHNDGLYICPVESCGAKFRSMNNAGGHLANHRGEDPYVCGQCGAVFKTYNVWARHKKRHQEPAKDVKQNKCSTCNETFAGKLALKQHMTIHMEGKPYVCEVCGKGYARKGSYNSHLLTHGDKMYNCQFTGCGQVFATSLVLRRHSAVHDASESLCSACGKIITADINQHACSPSIHEQQEPVATQQSDLGLTVETHPKDVQSDVHHLSQSSQNKEVVAVIHPDAVQGQHQELPDEGHSVLQPHSIRQLVVAKPNLQIYHSHHQHHFYVQQQQQQQEFQHQQPNHLVPQLPLLLQADHHHQPPSQPLLMPQKSQLEFQRLIQLPEAQRQHPPEPSWDHVPPLQQQHPQQQHLQILQHQQQQQTAILQPQHAKQNAQDQQLYHFQTQNPQLLAMDPFEHKASQPHNQIQPLVMSLGMTLPPAQIEVGGSLCGASVDALEPHHPVSTPPSGLPVNNPPTPHHIKSHLC